MLTILLILLFILLLIPFAVNAAGAVAQCHRVGGFGDLIGHAPCVLFA